MRIGSIINSWTKTYRKFYTLLSFKKPRDQGLKVFLSEISQYQQADFSITRPLNPALIDPSSAPTCLHHDFSKILLGLALISCPYDQP